jgi:hypothetical protein
MPIRASTPKPPTVLCPPIAPPPIFPHKGTNDPPPSILENDIPVAESKDHFQPLD